MKLKLKLFARKRTFPATPRGRKKPFRWKRRSASRLNGSASGDTATATAERAEHDDAAAVEQREQRDEAVTVAQRDETDAIDQQDEADAAVVVALIEETREVVPAFRGNNGEFNSLRESAPRDAGAREASPEGETTTKMETATVMVKIPEAGSLHQRISDEALATADASASAVQQSKGRYGDASFSSDGRDADTALHDPSGLCQYVRRPPPWPHAAWLSSLPPAVQDSVREGLGEVCRTWKRTCEPTAEDLVADLEAELLADFLAELETVADGADGRTAASWRTEMEAHLAQMMADMSLRIPSF